MYHLRRNKEKRSIQKLEDNTACFWSFHYYYFSMAAKIWLSILSLDVISNKLSVLFTTLHRAV